MYVPRHLSRFAPPFQTPIGQWMPLSEPYTEIDKLVAPPVDQNVKPFGEAVYKTFVGARFDVEEISRCLVAGAWTETVVHMMRSAEWGVRALGKDLQMSRITEVQHPKPGAPVKKPKVKRVPIENCVWERIHDQLRIRVDKRLAKLRPGPSKDRKQVFYYSVLSEFHDFRGT